MEVPDHLYYGGRGRNTTKQGAISRPFKGERNSFVDEMFVPDKITVGAGNVLIPHHHQPNDILRDKPVPPNPNERITPIPSKLTANEFPFEDLKKEDKKTDEARPQGSPPLKNADSANSLNTSLAVDSDPVRELKNIRRQVGRLATRILELEDENNRRANREYGLWAAITAGVVIIAFLIFRK